ncbi:hypothetical protein BC834DRAFT_967141 [Gloeopeniophorella convolvens]|nr:hypothetical protein BC834DRAFT_967141 [Gloeopeniophorella convolvens]
MSHTHLYYPLLFFFFLLAHPARAQTSAPAGVVWSSPAPGDRFAPGDTIVGKWQAPQRVVSPSFRLCAGGASGCGTTIWPDVQQSAGAYVVSLAAPNVSAEAGFYLQMKDDFGQTSTSPIFNLTPSPESPSAAAAPAPDPSEPVSPQPQPAQQAPLASKPSSGASPPPALPAQQPPNPSQPAGPPALAAPSTGPAATPPAAPLVAAAHAAPPAAALAVPLSLAGAIALLAGALALHHRRRLAAERARSAKEADGGAGEGEKDACDVERALFMHALLGGVADVPGPCPPRRDRERTRQAYVHPAPWQWPRGPQLQSQPPWYPDQQQHQHQQRPHYQSRGPSRALSSYSGYFGSRRAHAPPSPAVESVTSDVLPSYLPSPTFDHGGGSNYGGDIGFENVPLSPLPPPPLHVRDEAAEPNDARARELRGIYEAVARALGTVRAGSVHE